jgi:Na+/H+-dicarboxylate symporter
MDALQPGSGFALKGAVKGEIAHIPSLTAVILDIFPTNVVQAFANGDVMQMVVFGVLLGVATLWLQEPHRARVVLFLETGPVLLAGVVIAFGPIGLGVFTSQKTVSSSPAN